VFFRQRTVVDADHPGGWTQIFGGKALETETSGPVVKRNFYLIHLHFAPPTDSVSRGFSAIAELLVLPHFGAVHWVTV